MDTQTTTCTATVIGTHDDVAEALRAEGWHAQSIDAAFVSLVNAGRCGQHDFSAMDYADESVYCQDDVDALRAQLSSEPMEGDFYVWLYDGEDGQREVDLRTLDSDALGLFRDEASAHNDIHGYEAATWILKQRGDL